MATVIQIQDLPPEDVARVEALVRYYRSRRQDAVRLELMQAGIIVSRSALRRYVLALQERDANHGGRPAKTVVVLHSPETSGTVTLSTSLGPEDVIRVILHAEERGD